MTLAEHLLPKLSEWQPVGTGRHSCSESFPEAGWSVCITADRADSLSCLVWELTLTRTADAPAGLSVQAWADAIAGRVGGLLEDLKVYEVDSTRDEAVLRSDKPSKTGANLAYYEVQLHGAKQAVTRRFTAAPETPGRQQVGFALTHETLARLARDIAG